MPTLAEIYGTNTKAKGTTQSSLPVNKSTNNGGLIGGIGYLGEKNLVGFVSSIENVWDYSAASVAKLFGADEFAKSQLENDWFGDWYSHPDEWFNPQGVWKAAGDVSQGIGTSGPAIALSFIPYAGPVVSVVHSALSGAGGGLKEAYQDTGELGLKEFAYGTLAGGTEGVIEAVSNKLGIGAVGSVYKNIGKSATKSIASRVGVAAVEGFIGEAFEEGFTEFVNPYIKKITYDPNAKNATLEEIGYAALVGGLSGALLGGGGATLDASASLISGTNALKNGRSAEIMQYGEYATAFEDTQKTKNEYYDRVASSYKALQESLAKTDGKITTANQRMMLGDLERANVSSIVAQMMLPEAANIINDVDAFVERYNSYGYKDANGNTLTLTAEELTKGIDKNNPASLTKALKENEKLRTVTAMIVAGKMVANTSSMTNSILAGNRIGNKADLAWLSERASSEDIERLSSALGIENWNNLEDVNAKIDAYKQSDAYRIYKENAGYVEKIKKVESKRNMPKGIGGLNKDGAVARYSDGTIDVGVARVGDSYIIYDFNQDVQSRRMSKEEVDAFFKEYSKEKYSAEETKRKEASAKKKAEAEEIDTWARENIEDYATLSAPNKTMIRKVIRDARANGLSEADVKMWADMSAHSGLEIVFKDLPEGVNGYYEDGKNRIVVNPKAVCTQEEALFHELDHALRTYYNEKGEMIVVTYKEALDAVDENTKAEIKKKYGDDKKVLDDETNAFYASEIMALKGYAKALATKKPSIMKRIIAFFKDASNYKNERLSSTAKKYYKQYQKMYEEFSALNRGSNAYAGVGEGNKRYSYSSIAQTFFGGANIDVDTFKTYKNTQGYKDYVDKCLNNMRQTRENFNKDEARAEIEESIEGIVKVAIAAKKAEYDIADIEGADNKRDSKKRLLFSSLEPNSDYFTSHDIATICDKQRNFTEIYEEIVRREKELNVPPEKSFFKNVNNYFAIHKIMADMGLTTPCEQCYFNTMRKNLTPMAESFLKLVKEEDVNNKSNDALYNKKGELKSNNAKLREGVRKAFEENDYSITLAEMDAEMLTTRDGLARLKIQAPEVFEAFNSFYGQSKPKMPREAIPFRFGELTALLTDSNGKISKQLVEKIDSTGGFRLQSYSDFQIANYVDVLQVIFEAGTLGLTGHAYTKVPAFLEATKGTNLKRNISIFMYKDGTEWKIDRGDSFPAPLEDIIALVKADKSGNTGIIDVVQNQDNAAWVMANDDIGYGIPFHKSGAKMGVVREKIVRENGREIKGYKDIKDHTRQQTEVWAETKTDENGEVEHKAFTKVKKGINIYSFWDFDNKKGLTKKKLIRKNLKAYINACKDAGYIPKFREYLNNPSLLKDILAQGKKLGFLSENATIEDISFEYGGYRIPYGYYKFLGDFNMFKPNGEASPREVLSLKDYKFDDAVKFFEDAETVRRNEILQQFANGEERARYKESNLTTSQLKEIIEQKRKEVADKVVSKRYGLPEGARASLDLGIETKVLTEMPDKYKASVKEKISNAWTSVQISLTNEQAGIEKIGKKLGIKDIEARVQAVRASRNMAEMMLGDEQYRIGASGKDVVKQGEGLGKIFSHIKAEDEELFNTYLLHWHNTSRMTLAEKSQAQIDAAQKDFDTKAAEIVKANKALNKLVKQKEGVEPRSAEAKAINKKIAEARAKVIEARKAANKSNKALDFLTLEENKPIFAKSDGSFVTAEESKKIIAEIEKEHSDFKGVAEKVWAYSRNLNQYRVDTGLISQEEFDYLNEKYPYYVPTYRDGGAKGIVPITGSHDLAVKQTVKTAKGSGLDVLPIKAIMARQTMETVRAGQTNKLVKELYDARGNEEYIAEVSRKKNDDLEVNPTEQRPKDNQITFYDNGDKVTLSVSKEIFQGFEGFKGTALSDTDAFKAMNKINKGFKALVTSYSPAFMIRNPIRDIQDAGIYSKYGLTFAKNYARVGKLIAENSAEWQMYRAMGGLSSSLFDMDKGTKNSLNKWGLTKAEGNLLQKGLGAIENANVFLEQLPRFAEFLSSIEAGNTYEQAILDAADVTTNFGRTGKITKILNATVIPFLNPSIQGFSKMIRTVTSVKTAREAGALFIKAAILGVAPIALNMLMYGGDEDYEDLREEDKENNFLIKVGNTFIKLPRGRVASAIAGLFNRSVKTVKGEDADWLGYAENVSQQVTPVDSMTRTIFSPFYDLATNTTWYGTEIEGRQFENVAPRDRYDESTSEIAKVIGKVINYSPKKIHYLIDQYSGVIGDFILPLTSKKAEKDFFSGNFTIDPATSNKLSSSFYKKYEEAQYAKSAGDDVAKYQVRYLISVKSAVSELYKEKSAIQNSDLSSVEKLQQTRTIQILINEAFKTAMKDYDLYTKAFESTSAIEDENLRYVESMRLTQGAEKALEVYDEKVYEKYSLINKSGIDYDVLYYYYFVQKDIESDKDKNGNTIAGSKKEKALKLVNSLKIDKNQKLLLLAASGYSVGDRNTKLKLARYITSLKATKEEKAELAEMCGFKVKNGTILMSSIK